MPPEIRSSTATKRERKRRDDETRSTVFSNPPENGLRNCGYRNLETNDRWRLSGMGRPISTTENEREGVG
ncbi:hypothetical protein PAAG_04448 [Paracoccidioides lutzii Pb01]|uniref:Uncharacterized protein n=1 Tax=Paracoccidioides lutzii (strain ATCC MYA-826 / Pb01) TaxID=502779 RepID=C1H104_PARBA|nr:hypothetical protein PAAG_04448 [Paracoccidioides lutzii Pb01]EEH33398.2 hypothetical protein PAAG_04448 [Paracoccidioides lutzii Pb01]